MNAVEAELTTCLGSTAPVRAAAASRIAELLARIDGDVYAVRLSERGLLPLLGARALELAPAAADDLLRLQVEAALRETRLRALALEMTLGRVVACLTAAGVPALPIKGTTLAERVHGDAGVRPVTDVDVLVSRDQLDAAVTALRTLGYPAPEDPAWTDSLPELHYTFPAGDAGLRVELHWRVHWAERGFSEELMRASRPAPDGFLRAEPAHELALLLLIFGRDGLHGPRLAVDIATWWDVHRSELEPSALDGIASRHPSLRRSLVAAAMSLEPLLGAWTSRLLSDAVADRSTRRAVGLADPMLLDETADVEAKLMLIDVLLSRGRDKLGFVRRYVLQPMPFVRATYGLRDAPLVVVGGRNALHAAATVVKKFPRMLKEGMSRRTR